MALTFYSAKIPTFSTHYYDVQARYKLFDRKYKVKYAYEWIYTNFVSMKSRLYGAIVVHQQFLEGPDSFLPLGSHSPHSISIFTFPLPVMPQNMHSKLIQLN